MTPKEISEYIFSEFTPLSKMSQEDAKIHVEQLIEKACADYHSKALLRLTELLNENMIVATISPPERIYDKP